jgi:uncharacterized protein
MTMLPPHAHRPGRNARHPDDRFDAIKASVAPGMDAGRLAATEAWTAGWRYLEAGYCWEAHEVWEAVWMACPPNSAEKQMLAGLIQVANARLKLAMGMPAAAKRILTLAQGHFAEAAARCGHSPAMGVTMADTERLVGDTVQASGAGRTVQDSAKFGVNSSQL